MKIKNLIAVAALLLVGTSAFGQTKKGDTFEYGNYNYTLTSDVKNLKATVEMTSIAEDGTPVTNHVLDFPGSLSVTFGSKTYEYSVTTMAPDVFKDKVYNATSVTIPKQLTVIPLGAFNSCTNLESIVFEAGSQVQRIMNQAFASTHITKFDFSPCTLLEGLDDEVFIEDSEEDENPNLNTWITEVVLPTSSKFKHMNGAFRNLPNLTTITNLENSWIQEVVAEAFRNDAKFTVLNLPGKNLQYIDMNALVKSSVKELSIDVSSLLYLGGCNVGEYQVSGDPVTGQPVNEGDYIGEYTYVYDAPADAEANLYGFDEKDKTPLEKLTLTGTLQGRIATNAFLWCNKMVLIHDLADLYYGSQAQIQASAFESCLKIEALVINDINDNRLPGDAYTIDADAFMNCPVATLTMNNVRTANAVGAAAFGTSLETVTIKTVKAEDEAFAEGAFVWADVDGTTLTIAAGNGEYISNDAADQGGTLLFPAGAFDFSAVGTETEIEVWPVVSFGEIASKGGVFTEGAVKGPVQKMYFTGDINTNGVDAALLTPNGRDSKLTTLRFDGAIKTQGLTNAAFAEFPKVKTITFKGEMKENAVDEGVFVGTGASKDGKQGAGLTVKYTVRSLEDPYVNPFNSASFSDDECDERVIKWEVADATLSQQIHDAIQNGYAICEQLEDYVPVSVSAKFNVYKWEAEIPEDKLGFIVFQDLKGNDKIAWGRYDLGSFEQEKGPDAEYENGDYIDGTGYEQTNMIIPRYQEVEGGAKVKLTIYGMYSDEDNFEQKSSVYMVPLKVSDGHYFISEDNTNVLIIKAEIQGDGAFADKDVLISYIDEESLLDESDYADEYGAKGNLENPLTIELYNSVYDQLTSIMNPYTETENPFLKADISWTNQQLIDQAIQLVDGNPVQAPNIYEYNEDGKITKDLWIMTDPAKYKGFRVDKNEIKRGGAYIGKNWYYTLLLNYDAHDPEARVIWLDDAQATAIFGVKDLKAKAESVNGAIYNLQGIRVSTPSKGLYIMNGKKYVVK